MASPHETLNQKRNQYEPGNHADEQVICQERESERK
jgi:hypothetical protein